jgi:antimicrobial peptide system SdpA family protein
MGTNNYKNVLTFIWTLLAILIFFSSLKSQIVLNEDIKNTITIIFPEGWGFFTKNPRDLAMEIYKIENGKLKLLDGTNGSSTNLYGLSRSARLIGYETSTAVSEIDSKQWTNCKTRNIKDNINIKTYVIKKRNYFNHLKAGVYLVKAFKPIPFAWSKSNQQKFNPFSVIKIQIL